MLRPACIALAAWVALATATTALAAPNAPAAPAQPSWTDLQAEKPKSIRKLPSRVKARPGKLTLFADYKRAAGDKVPVYLVNRTKRSFDLPAQDNVLYLKLEAKLPVQGWTRVQRHVYSSCGNSYFPRPKLKPGQFVRMPGWLPSTGETGRAAKVRYRLYDDLKVVSNVGFGHYLPAEAKRARIDAMSLRTANAALIRELLLGRAATKQKRGSRRGWELSSARGAAIRRIPKLPLRDAVPLAEGLVSARGLDANEFSSAIRVLHKVAPDRLAAHIHKTLAGPKSATRNRWLDELPFIARLNNTALIADLLGRAQDPRSSDVPMLLDYLAGYQSPATEALLFSVQTDARYPRPTRIRARFNLESWSGTKGVELRILPIGSYGNGHKRPVHLKVSIVNSSASSISFSYRDPTEILSFYLTRSSRRSQTFLPPRKGVTWWKKTGASPAINRVTLAPGASHDLKVAVEDYFDLPSNRGHGLSVWASVRLPGYHQTPRLAGGGAGINPK